MNLEWGSLPSDPDVVPPYPDLLSLKGSVALLAGAGSGMGRQIAHALSAVGALVVCADLDEKIAAKTAAEVNGIPVAGDVSNRRDVERIVKVAAAAGPLRVLVDLVGGSRFKPLLEMTEEDWDWHERINVRHAHLLITQTAPVIAANGGGSMVFIASKSGHTASQLQVPYGVYKASLQALVRSAGVELGEQNIRVNSVSPGTVWTPVAAARASGGISKERWDSLFPLGRVALPWELASVVLFLASPLAEFINCQDISVDGGLGVKNPYPVDELVAAVRAMEASKEAAS